MKRGIGQWGAARHTEGTCLSPADRGGGLRDEAAHTDNMQRSRCVAKAKYYINNMLLSNTNYHINRIIYIYELSRRTQLFGTRFVRAKWYDIFSGDVSRNSPRKSSGQIAGRVLKSGAPLLLCPPAPLHPASRKERSSHDRFPVDRAPTG